MNMIVNVDRIQCKILNIRGVNVILDKDIAELYNVETRVLNQAVKRNMKRFPADFMFQLNKEETSNWISQSVMSNSVKMGVRRNPYAFTEQGVAMLSGLLNSEKAIEVNVAIVRAFVKIRQIAEKNGEILLKLMNLENKVEKHDGEIKAAFSIMKKMIEEPPKNKSRIGFKPE